MSDKHVSRFILIFATVMFALMSAQSFAFAEDKKAEKILEKVSKEAGLAMRDVRFARVALFEGDAKDAVQYVEDAKKKLAAAEKNAPKLVVTVKSEEKSGDKTITSHKASQTDEFVTIDAWLMLSEDFVPSQEKSKKIKEANEHLKKGESAKAVEVLRTADIGVSVTRLLLPLKLTMDHVNSALQLMKDNAYYEANLALKGAEDGVITDTVLLYEPVKPAKKE